MYARLCDLPIRTSPLLVETTSVARSPGRAARRWRRGIRRSNPWRQTPLRRVLLLNGALYCHPDLLPELRAMVARAWEGSGPTGIPVLDAMEIPR